MGKHFISDRFKVSIFTTGFSNGNSKFIFVRDASKNFSECSKILSYCGMQNIKHDDILVFNSKVLEILPTDLTVLYLGNSVSALDAARQLKEDSRILQNTFVIPVDDFDIDAMNLLDGYYKESEVFVEEEEITLTRYKLSTKQINTKSVIEDSIIKKSLVSRLLSRLSSNIHEVANHRY